MHFIPLGLVSPRGAAGRAVEIIHERKENKLQTKRHKKKIQKNNNYLLNRKETT